MLWGLALAYVVLWVQPWGVSAILRCWAEQATGQMASLAMDDGGCKARHQNGPSLSREGPFSVLHASIPEAASTRW